MRTTVRIDKLLSSHGFGTRKDVKKLLHSGSVTVDGTTVTAADSQVEPETQIIRVNGEQLVVQQHIYIMMNKCRDVVCATKDGLHKTVFDLLDAKYRGRLPGGELHITGRLDIDTEGLLLLTTDGKLTHRLTSPKTHVPKTYYVELASPVSEVEKEEYTALFKNGIDVPAESNEEAFKAQSAMLCWEKNDDKICTLTIHEGKYHQIKRMFKVAGNEVSYLKRIAIGKLSLDPALQTGTYRELSESELQLLTQ